MNTRSQPHRSFAIAGAVEPIWLLGASAAIGALRPGYDASHAISELGQQGSAGAVAWNIGGFGVSAVLYAIFALAIRGAVGDGWLFRVVLLQAVFLALGGTFGCDPGCPPIMTTWQGWAHTVVGLTFFVLTCVSPIIAWRAFRRGAEWRSLAVPSLTTGLILVGLFLAGPFIFPAEVVGYWQRITLGIAGAWTTLIAVRLWRLPSALAEGRQRSDPVRAGTAADLP